MKRRLFVSVPLFLALGCLCAVAYMARAQATRPAPLKILFLGDNASHRPAERFPLLEPVLKQRGIELTYTDKMSDLNPETLNQYDGLMIYANVTQISPEQEKAMVDYVRAGHGLIPIHCASFCFQNSPAYIAMVGGQFQRHRTGTFNTRITDANHPIMKGFTPFETWDETYDHTKLAADIHVLQVRPESGGGGYGGDKEEPWTWIRNEGAGRVFYTAYGHDQRTWGQAGFHDLVERGVRWATSGASGFEGFKTTGPTADAKPFEYVPAEGVPFYEPGARGRGRGGRGEWSQMPRPMAAEESAKHLILPEGFEAKLFAADPDIIKPIAMAWDERGRLWVVESLDYPNKVIGAGQGNDRIKICEDTDGDGRADKFTIFAEGLNLPTSIVFSNGGIIIPEFKSTWFLKDNDGDGKSDVKQELFTGWHPPGRTMDTHGGTSNLRYGLDNWIWGMVGYDGFNGTVGGEQVRFSQGFFRFKPDVSKLEFIRSTSNNTWGIGFSDEGIAFGSTANNCPSVYMPIPNRYYEMVRGGFSPAVLRMISPNSRFQTPNPKIRQVDVHGGYTAAAGHALYTARAYPKEYWNRTAFVAEPTGHIVGTFVLERQGADFKSHNPVNLLGSMDEWTSPIMAEVGPDGFVWVLDWYAYIVQHNPTPQGYQRGAGNAYETPRRDDHKHGRVYRIAYRGATPGKTLDLSKATGTELVAALRNDNLLWRSHAQRLLVERQDKTVINELIKLVGDQGMDEIGLNTGAIHALWTLKGLGALDGTNREALAAATGALKHPSGGVRRNAVQVLPSGTETLRSILDANLLADTDAQVRLMTVLAIADQPATDPQLSERVGTSLKTTLEKVENSRDRWIPEAAVAAAARFDAAFLKAVITGAAVLQVAPPVGRGGRGNVPAPAAGPDAKVAETARVVARHYAASAPWNSIVATLEALPSADPIMAENILDGLVDGWPARNASAAGLSQADEARLVELSKTMPAGQLDRLLVLAVRWGNSSALAGRMQEVLTSLQTTLASGSAAASERAETARRLIRLRDDASTTEAILGQLTPQASPELAQAMILSLGDSRLDTLGQQLVVKWTILAPATRTAAVSVLIRRTPWTNALLQGVQDRRVARNDLSASDWQVLKASRDRNIAAWANVLDTMTTDADRQKVFESMLPALEKPGDVAIGKQLFTARCVVCHTIDGQGSKLGPDLTGFGIRDPRELLAEVVDPNRSVEANYRMWILETKDGTTITGRLNAETQTTVEILDATNKSHVTERQNIERLIISNMSIMPVGLMDTATHDEIASLLAYLKTSQTPPARGSGGSSGNAP